MKFKCYFYYLLFVFFFFLIIFLAFFNYKLLFFYHFYSNNRKRPIIIEFETYGSSIGEGDPAKFVRGMKELLPYNTSFCTFISSDRITPNNGKNKSDYFYLPFPLISESFYDEWANISRENKLLLGPCFVPSYWRNFPNNNIWKERRFREILKSIKGVIVHSTRVRNYLSKRTNTTDLFTKYKIVRPCTNLMPKYVNSFNNRKIDILLFEKYTDLNRRKQAIQLINLFNNSSKKIERIEYGNYTKDKMVELANNSKFIVYFSFFDTGAIDLKEIQNHGVFTFSHQKDLVISKKTGFYIPELTNENDMNEAYINIMKKIEIILNKHSNTQLIAKINQEINKCQNAFDDLCKSLL